MTVQEKRIPKTWFITGSSRGFGRVWAEAALERGDKVAATARDKDSLADLQEKFRDSVLTLTLDVTKPEQAEAAVNQAFAHFGGLDIVLNNAGYSLVSTIEEAKVDEVKAMYETNVYGPLHVIKAALPLLRKQGHGHIMGTSSNLGHLAYPVIGYYCSSKWAFESIHEALAKEIEQFNIKVTIIEPGAYATEFGSQQSLKFAEGMEIYAPFKEQFVQQVMKLDRGNPDATPQALFQVVDAKNPPLRFHLGSHNLSEVSKAYEERLSEWEAWDAVSSSAQGESISH